MHRSLNWLILAVFSLAFCVDIAAVDSASAANTTCNFYTEKQIAVDYEQVHLSPGKQVLGGSVPYGKVWAPGGKPLTLFTNTPLTIGGANIADGAYTMFVIPEEKSWTLVSRRAPTPAENMTRHTILPGSQCNSASFRKRNRHLPPISHT